MGLRSEFLAIMPEMFEAINARQGFRDVKAAPAPRSRCVLFKAWGTAENCRAYMAWQKVAVRED
jgi:hypothetical protein